MNSELKQSASAFLRLLDQEQLGWHPLKKLLQEFIDGRDMPPVALVGDGGRWVTYTDENAKAHACELNGPLNRIIQLSKKGKH